MVFIPSCKLSQKAMEIASEGNQSPRKGNEWKAKPRNPLSLVRPNSGSRMIISIFMLELDLRGGLSPDDLIIRQKTHGSKLIKGCLPDIRLCFETY